MIRNEKYNLEMDLKTIWNIIFIFLLETKIRCLAQVYDNISGRMVHDGLPKSMPLYSIACLPMKF